MTITKILKNVSGSTRNVLNRQLVHNESYILPHGQWGKLADHQRTLDDIAAGLVIVNNGTSDLSPANGLLHVAKYDLQSAAETPFNNSVNSFSSTTSQAAIEESKASAIAIGRAIITTTFNSTIGNGDWLGYSELIPGDQVPIRIPFKCRLKEIQFSYKNSSLLGIPTGSNLITGRFDLYKNGQSSPSNVIYQGQFTNQAGGKLFTEINVDFVAGDWIVGRWVDQGSNPADTAIMYIFEMRT